MIERSDLELFARTLRRAVEGHTGRALDAALEEIGWREAFAVDTRAAVSTLFGLQGEMNGASSALDHVVTSALGLEPTATGIVLPPLGERTPPGQVDGRRLLIRGLGTSALADRDSAVVVARARDADVAVVVAVDDLTLRQIRGIDPELGLIEVRGDLPVAAKTEPLSRSWASAVALGQLALAHELLGASRKMLALAREHALTRIQFGKPIGSFQAVRHRLAETLVAIEAADAVLAEAWEEKGDIQNFRDEKSECPLFRAAMAKALAGRAARTAARHCQQVLGGIGFTTDHPLHRSVRRVLVLDQLLGSAHALTRELGVELLTTRKLPPLLPL